MRLDVSDLSFLTSEEFKVLSAVEECSKSHEVVPSAAAARKAGLRSGGVNKILGVLASRNLVARVVNARYDGYRLTYGGLDYLAVRALMKKGVVGVVGHKVGIGKESDIHLVRTGSHADGLQLQHFSSGGSLASMRIANLDDRRDETFILKLHRLGRMSFRQVKTKREYIPEHNMRRSFGGVEVASSSAKSARGSSWMDLSTLSAAKEYAFMNVLYTHGFPVPRPIEYNRHCIVMELIDARPLRAVDAGELTEKQVSKLFDDLMQLIMQLAGSGLVHGDFNEFNLLLNSENKIILIDFPQMISTKHPHAQDLFNRDVKNVVDFFTKKFRFHGVGPQFTDVVDVQDLEGSVKTKGFSKFMHRQLEEYLKSGGRMNGREDDECEEGDSEDGDSDKSEDQEIGSAQSGVKLKHADSKGTDGFRRGSEEEDEQDEKGAQGAEESEERLAGEEQDDDLYNKQPHSKKSTDTDSSQDSLKPQETPPQASLNKSRPDSSAIDEITQDIRKMVASDINRRQQKHLKFHNTRVVLGRPRGSKLRQSKKIDLDYD